MNINVSAALRRRVDAFRSNGNLAEAGRKLVHEDVVAVSGFPDTVVRLFDDWAADPHDSRSWQWSIAAFRFVPSVIAHHAGGGDPAAIEWALRALRSWRQAVRGKLKHYEFARNDHAVANQAENLVFLLAYLQMRDLHDEARHEIAAAIHEHADLLATEAFYSRHTNHGIEQARVLAVVANLFADDPRSQARMTLATDRLVDELDFAFTKEGVHVENSPGYHAYVCLSFLKILDFFPREEIALLADRVDALMPRAIRFLTHIVRPDGTLPIIGDTVADPPQNYFRRYRKIRDYAYFRYAASDGAEGHPSSLVTALYPQAGYFVCRDAWHPPGRGRDAFHLVFRCGYRSRYHRHDDDLNVVLYCAGEDWLIDSGAYNYAEQDPLRRYMRSKWAHNVPVVMSPPEKRWELEKPIMAIPLARLPAPVGSVSVRGISHCYPGHVAMRDLTVNAGAREFTVVDSLIPSGRRARRRYLSLWHVPHDKDVRIEGQQVEVMSRTSGRRLVIKSLDRSAKSIALLDPQVEGVAGARVSWSSNRAEPAQLLAFEWETYALQSVLQFKVEDDQSEVITMDEAG